MLGCTLHDLPLPELSRTGWPWTDAPEPLPALMPDGQPWPRISIVTPSYNQGQFIEKTIRSVLLQGYPNLEYFIIDGGSTDQSVEIIRKYEPWLMYWVSEQDRGQSHAIVKGLERCHGELFNWLNSDDYLLPGALAAVARQWVGPKPHLVTGRALSVDLESGKIICDWSPRALTQPIDFQLIHRMGVAQPATFLALDALRKVGGIRQDLHYVMDWELYLRLSLQLRDQLRAATIPAMIAHALQHPEAKTVRHSVRFRIEVLQVLDEIRETLSVDEALGVRRYVDILNDQSLINALAMASQPCWRLACLPFYRPRVMRQRFFWGALRRALYASIQVWRTIVLSSSAPSCAPISGRQWPGQPPDPQSSRNHGAKY